MFDFYKIVGVVIAVLAALTFTHGFVYKAGRAAVRADWDKEKIVQLAAQQNAIVIARAKEQSLNAINAKVTNDYLTQKKLRAADAVTNDQRLRNLRETIIAGSADTNTGPVSGTDDPRDAVIDQCATALFGMDQYAKDLALKATVLQRYTREVCMTK